MASTDISSSARRGSGPRLGAAVVGGARARRLRDGGAALGRLRQHARQRLVGTALSRVSSPSSADATARAVFSCAASSDVDGAASLPPPSKPQPRDHRGVRRRPRLVVVEALLHLARHERRRRRARRRATRRRRRRRRPPRRRGDDKGRGLIGASMRASPPSSCWLKGAGSARALSALSSVRGASRERCWRRSSRRAASAAASAARTAAAASAAAAAQQRGGSAACRHLLGHPLPRPPLEELHRLRAAVLVLGHVDGELALGLHQPEERQQVVVVVVVSRSNSAPARTASRRRAA